MELNTYDRVLVRNYDTDNWKCNFFSNYSSVDKLYITVCGRVWKQCVKYEGNEHLLNTRKYPTNTTKSFRFGDKVMYRCCKDDGYSHQEDAWKKGVLQTVANVSIPSYHRGTIKDLQYFVFNEDCDEVISCYDVKRGWDDNE